MVELDLFVPFVRTADDSTALLEVLCAGYTELLALQQTEFQTTVVSEKFLFHLDTYLRFSWRPWEVPPFASGTHAYSMFHQLRMQVLDTLSRACKEDSSNGAMPLIDGIVSSAATALDICSLYAYDQLVACQRIMDTVVKNSSKLTEISNTMLHLDDHMAQLHAWVKGLDASVSPQHVDDVIACLEDTLATLLSLFLSTPRLCSTVMREADHPFTSTLAQLHDVFLSSTLPSKISALPGSAALKDRVAAISVICEKVACMLLSELLKVGRQVAVASTSTSPINDGELLMAALVNMQIPMVDHRKSLLAKIPEHGFVADIDKRLRCCEMVLDEAQYSYLLTLLNLPDKAMPGVGSATHGNAIIDDNTPDAPPVASKTNVPQYNRAQKLELIQTVKACLPAEDETLIEACLSSMDWNTERCVDAILQDKLPGHLRAKAASTSCAPEKDLIYAPGRPTSYGNNRGHVKDLKQKTFELLQLAEDAEDEYDDEYDDGFDALNFAKGYKDVRMEADSTEPDKATFPETTERHPHEDSNGSVRVNTYHDEGGERGRGRGDRRENSAGRARGRGDRGRGSRRGRHTRGRGGRDNV